MDDDSTIKDGEYHPAADSAMAWVKGFMVRYPHKYLLSKESLASTALAGNRLSQICMGTIERMAKGEPVSDRYLLGLAWTLMKLHIQDDIEKTEAYRLDTWKDKSS